MTPSKFTSRVLTAGAAMLSRSTTTATRTVSRAEKTDKENVMSSAQIATLLILGALPFIILLVEWLYKE